MIYLNQAGTSWPKPVPVRAAVAEALERPPETWAADLETGRAQVARFFGISDPERLLLTPGCTSALAAALGGQPWQAGDRLVLSSLEHQALHGPARRLEAAGVEIQVVPRTGSGPFDLEAFEKQLRRGRVRMVAVSAASNVTGELLPVAEIVALSRRSGALTLIDAAQVAGWIDWNVEQVGADLLAFAGHKGPQAPWGIGGLYVAPGIDPMPGYCDVGSVDRAGLAGLVAGLGWLGEPAQAGRLERARTLLARLAEEVLTLKGVELHGWSGVASRVPSLALTAARRGPAELARALASRGIMASGGQQCAPLAHVSLGTAPAGVLRISVGPSNGAEDVEGALRALRDLL